jgi:pimeloyl-ACP methyl ester carboxylesterase
MFRTVRLALACVAGAALLVPLAAAAPHSAAAGRDSGARYCPRDDAYQLDDCRPAPRLPDGPLGSQLRWLLNQLAGGSARLTVAEVRAHLSPGLQQVQPAEEVLGALRRTLAERGPLRLVGYSYPPRWEQAVALVRAGSGQRAAVAIAVDGALIDSVAVDAAPPTPVPRGRNSGWFDVGGRRLFLRCTGSGGPTVVFENGLTTDWYPLQNQLSGSTRVCSYDPARMAGAWGRSDPASAPRDGIDRVGDLHALLAAARVPGPYVLVGHSNGGLFSLLYASRYPAQVAGLVLLDGVHPSYHRRSIAVAKRFAPREHWDQLVAAACGIPPVQLDGERMDICRAEAQTRAALAAHPLRRMPLAVLSRDRSQFPPNSLNAAQEQLWRQLQDELAAMEPGSWHVTATGSGHDIAHERPDLVIAGVRRVLAEVGTDADRRGYGRRCGALCRPEARAARVLGIMLSL